jgi:hypothetical protein
VPPVPLWERRVARYGPEEEDPMVNWEPITYDDLIILTEWMVVQGYSAAHLAEAVREPARYNEELRTAVRSNAELAARQRALSTTSQQQEAAEFMADGAVNHGLPAA